MNRISDEKTQSALNEMLAAARISAVYCSICLDSNMTLEDERVKACPAAHAPELVERRSAAAKTLARLLHNRQRAGAGVDAHLFALARLLTLYTSTRPIKRDLLDVHFATDERTTKKHIEQLRADWLLPVGSRKFEPVGYWIITDSDDYLAWEKNFLSSPKTQMKTCYALRKANFPQLAGQEILQFEK